MKMTMMMTMMMMMMIFTWTHRPHHEPSSLPGLGWCWRRGIRHSQVLDKRTWAHKEPRCASHEKIAICQVQMYRWTAKLNTIYSLLEVLLLTLNSSPTIFSLTPKALTFLVRLKVRTYLSQTGQGSLKSVFYLQKTNNVRLKYINRKKSNWHGT